MSFIKALIGFITSAFKPFKGGDSAGNMPSPRVDIAWGDIRYDRASRRLTIENIEPDVTMTTVQDTNSMEPAPDAGHIVIASNSPKYMDDLGIGDRVIRKGDSGTVLHAIVTITADEGGAWYETQGVNIPRKDPGRFRREDILSCVLMEIYCKGEGYYTAREGD